MKKSLLWLVVLVLSISMIATFSLAGCKEEEEAAVAEEEEEAAPAVEEEEEVVEEALELGTEGLTYWIDKAGITPSGEFTIYSYKAEGVTEWKIAEKYVETYPDVKLNWVSIPGTEYASKIAIEFETDTATFDCFWSYAAWTTQFAPYLEDVTDRIPVELKDDILKGIVSATAVGDIWYGAPLFCSTYSLVYNKDILKQAGYDKAPETWDEFFECAEACTIDEDNDGIPEIYGLGSGNVNPMGYFALFGVACKSVGGQFWNYDSKNPKPMFNNDKGVRALQILKKVYMSDFSDPVMAAGDEAVVRRSVASGKAAMGTHCVGAVEGVALSDFPENKGKFDYSLFPHDPGCESWSIPGSMGFGIRKGGNVDAALGYILFYLSPEMQKFMTQDYGFPTSRYSLVFDEEYITEYPYVKAAVEQAGYGGERYVEANQLVIQDLFFPIFESYLNGDIDEETALSQMEEVFNEAWEE